MGEHKRRTRSLAALALDEAREVELNLAAPDYIISNANRAGLQQVVWAERRGDRDPDAPQPPADDEEIAAAATRLLLRQLVEGGVTASGLPLPSAAFPQGMRGRDAETWGAWQEELDALAVVVKMPRRHAVWLQGILHREDLTIRPGIAQWFVRWRNYLDDRLREDDAAASAKEGETR